MSDREPFCCPHCRRPWDSTEAAVVRMQRITNAETTLGRDIEEPGFVSDLLLVMEALTNARNLLKEADQ